MARQETPLHYAAIRGNAEMIQLLLDAKADMQMESKYGENPCDVAGQGVAAFLQSHDSSEVITLLHGNYLKWRESRTAQDLSPWGQKMVCTRWGIDIWEGVGMLCFHDFFQKSPARLPLFFAFHLEGQAADRTIGLWLVV